MILHYLRSAAIAALLAGASYAAVAEENAKAHDAAKADDAHSDHEKASEAKSDDAKSEEKKEEVKKEDEKKEEKKSDEAKSEEKKDDAKKEEDKKPEEAKSEEKKEESKKDEPAKAGEEKSKESKAGTLDSAEIEKIIGEYLKKKPEVVYEALTAYQQKEEQERDKKAAEAVKSKLPELTASEFPSYGSKEPDVVISEFFDYSCGYCKRAFPQVYDLVKQDGKVKIVFHDFPILGESSKLNAQAAVAINLTQPDKYFEAHSLLMKNRYATKEALGTALKEIGVDFEKVSAKMDSDEVKKELLKTADLARSIGIQGTPAFIIGERFVPGAISLEDMKQIIDEERKKKAAN